MTPIQDVRQGEGRRCCFDISCRPVSSTWPKRFRLKLINEKGSHSMREAIWGDSLEDCLAQIDLRFDPRCVFDGFDRPSGTILDQLRVWNRP